MRKWTAKKITSLYHPLVKHLVKLREKRSYREESQSVVVYGRKIVEELAQKHSLKSLLLLEESFPVDCRDTYLVSEEILKKISGVPSPDGVVAEFQLPPPSDLKKAKKILALERVSDPGNLGALLRSACAFDWDGIFLLPDCVDLFHEKAIRSSRGACFYVPYKQGSWDDLLALAKSQQLDLLIAHMDGRPFDEISSDKGQILVLSHEGEGPSAQAKQAGTLIRVPQSPQMESLNVAVAGSILLYHFNHPKS